jgi:trans-2,3-dihydro-3-hydroxyanthranilate isomerase
MKYQFYTCDVFTEERFGGNQLAVLPKASGLSDRQMQQITREFNYSETAFVFPAEAGQTRKVRIFTPAQEIPFAGHPNVGTAFVLATIGELGDLRSSQVVTFEEKAGLVPIQIQTANGKVISCELTAPASLSLGEEVPVELVAAAVSLDAKHIATQSHSPQLVSVGLPFIITELPDRGALERVKINTAGFEKVRDHLDGEAVRASIYLYTSATGEVDLRARMLAPLSGVPEDPATGSATCAVVGLLAQLGEKPTDSLKLRIAQGVEMGRPSLLSARAEKVDAVVRSTHVGGACVLVSEGMIEVDSGS